jgi:hypothetical protein
MIAIRLMIATAVVLAWLAAPCPVAAGEPDIVVAVSAMSFTPADRVAGAVHHPASVPLGADLPEVWACLASLAAAGAAESPWAPLAAADLDMKLDILRTLAADPQPLAFPIESWLLVGLDSASGAGGEATLFQLFPPGPAVRR